MPNILKDLSIKESITNEKKWVKIFRFAHGQGKSCGIGKSNNRKTFKNRENLEKSDLISYKTLWQKCQCHKMPKCLHFGSGSCIRIFFLNAYNAGTRGPT